jgi:hypothetical protein
VSESRRTHVRVVLEMGFLKREEEEEEEEECGHWK